MYIEKYSNSKKYDDFEIKIIKKHVFIPLV